MKQRENICNNVMHGSFFPKQSLMEVNGDCKNEILRVWSMEEYGK